MPKVKFLQDFQGKETREVFYKQGQVVNLPDELLDRLLVDKRVEVLKPDVALDVEPQFENAYYGAQSEPKERADDVLYDVMTTPKKKGGKK